MKTIFVRVKNETQLKAAENIAGQIFGEQKIVLLKPLYMKDSDSRAWDDVFTDLPYILRENKRQYVESYSERIMKSSGVVVKNIDEIGLLKSLDFHGSVIADSFLYAYNSEALKFYKDLFENITFMLPDELTDGELLKMQGSREQIYKIYGRQPVMFTAQSISANYEVRGMVSLESVKKDELLAVDEMYGYTTVYTADPVSMTDKAEELAWKKFLVDLTTEGENETADVLRRVSEAVNGRSVKPDSDTKINRGHHFRGID